MWILIDHRWAPWCRIKMLCMSFMVDQIILVKETTILGPCMLSNGSYPKQKLILNSFKNIT